MKLQALSDEIRELNLSYLILAKQLILKDRDQAQLQLGMHKESISILETLSTSQLIQLASTNLLLCSMRFDDEQVWRLLVENSHKDAILGRTHQAILTSSKAAEAISQD